MIGSRFGNCYGSVAGRGYQHCLQNSRVRQQGWNACQGDQGKRQAQHPSRKVLLNDVRYFHPVSTFSGRNIVFLYPTEMILGSVSSAYLLFGG